MFKQGGNFNRKDRFIPTRYNANFEISNYLLNAPNMPESLTEDDLEIPNNKKRFVNFTLEYWKRANYQTRLQRAMQLSQTKVLNIGTRSNAEIERPEKFSRDWPVKRRLQPLIEAPTKILDMPNINHFSNSYLKVIDLSVNGCIASIFNSEIYLWNLENKLNYEVTYTNGRVSECVKWNRKGTLFAASLKFQGIALFNCYKKGILRKSHCICKFSPYCSITAIEWSSNNTLVTACSYGLICLWDDQLKSIVSTHLNNSKLQIFTLGLSAGENFLAAACVDGSVEFYLWPSLKPHFKIQLNSSIKMAWHPWKDSLIALGGSCQNGSIILFNASSKKSVCSASPIREDTMVIDCLSFSSLTGELIVSYCTQANNSRSTLCAIVILSNLHTVEDTIHYHSNRVIDFLWGNEGTTLGTVSTDETLCLWNFMGNRTGEVKRRLKKASEERKKYSLNPADNLNLFGATIR